MALNEKGYTLLELLVVISIVITMTSISMGQFIQTKTKDPVEQFIETFENDVFRMQQQAITYQKTMTLIFNLKDHYYYIYDYPTNPLFIKREYDPNLYLDLTSFSRPFRFQTTGIPLNPGSLIISYKQRHYQIIFPFGKGRFYVDEL